MIVLSYISPLIAVALASQGMLLCHPYSFSNYLMLGRCSVNGKVCVRYLNGTDDDREATSYLSLKDAATTVCIEDNKATATYPKDRTYIIGIANSM